MTEVLGRSTLSVGVLPTRGGTGDDGMQLDPNDRFDRVVGAALEAEMRPPAEKMARQYLLGILTVDDLIGGLQAVKREVGGSTLWEHTE